MSRQVRVLIVEDNLANQLLAAAVLERDGIEVDLVGTSEEAMASLKVRLPDVILMDLQLDGIGGLDLTHKLKSDPRTAAIPVVAVTANAMNGHREMALEAGCDGYVSKPIDTRTFADVVRHYVASPA
jgi:CheY-like chemotaxis protein